MAAPGMHARSLLRPAFVLPLAWLAATLVNVTKAVHMDDSTYLILARQILQDPLHPLAGTIVLSGETWPAASVNQPPLLLYGFAAVMAAFGESELALHLFVSIFSAAALLLFHALARRLCPRHALALTLAFVLGPAFLPGQNLMMDVPLVALWLAFFWLLLCGGETRAPRYVAAAAVAGAACLVKYTSLVLVPLLLIPVIVRREERYAGVVAMPIAVLAAWSIWNLLDYGEVHLFTRVAHAGEHSPLLGRAEAWLECLGGVAPFSIALAPLFARHRHALSLLAGSSALVGLLYYGSLGAESGPTPVFKAVFLTNGLLVTLVAGAALRPRPGERREDAALLGGWLVAGTLFPVLLAPFMAVRHVLPVIPALLLVLGRWIEGPGAARWARVGVGLSVLLGVALAVADWQYADVFRTQAGALRERFGAQARLWHLGGWGWRWYAEAHGMEPYLNDSSVLRAGDLVLIPQATAGPNGVARRDQPRVRLIDVVEPLPPSWLLPRIMLPFPRGGYYAVGSEGLPWTFSRTPLERILVFRVGEERRAAPGRPR